MSNSTDAGAGGDPTVRVIMDVIYYVLVIGGPIAVSVFFVTLVGVGSFCFVRAIRKIIADRRSRRQIMDVRMEKQALRKRARRRGGESPPHEEEIGEVGLLDGDSPDENGDLKRMRGDDGSFPMRPSDEYEGGGDESGDLHCLTGPQFEEGEVVVRSHPEDQVEGGDDLSGSEQNRFEGEMEGRIPPQDNVEEPAMAYYNTDMLPPQIGNEEQYHSAHSSSGSPRYIRPAPAGPDRWEKHYDHAEGTSGVLLGDSMDEDGVPLPPPQRNLLVQGLDAVGPEGPEESIRDKEYDEQTSERPNDDGVPNSGDSYAFPSLRGQPPSSLPPIGSTPSQPPFRGPMVVIEQHEDGVGAHLRVNIPSPMDSGDGAATGQQVFRFGWETGEGEYGGEDLSHASEGEGRIPSAIDVGQHLSVGASVESDGRVMIGSPLSTVILDSAEGEFEQDRRRERSSDDSDGNDRSPRQQLSDVSSEERDTRSPLSIDYVDPTTSGPSTPTSSGVASPLFAPTKRFFSDPALLETTLGRGMKKAAKNEPSVFSARRREALQGMNVGGSMRNDPHTHFLNQMARRTMSYASLSAMQKVDAGNEAGHFRRSESTSGVHAMSRIPERQGGISRFL